MQWECMGLTPLEHVNMIKEASPNIQNSILLFFYIQKITRKFIICSIKIKKWTCKIIHENIWMREQSDTDMKKLINFLLLLQETKLRWHQSHILHR